MLRTGESRAGGSRVAKAVAALLGACLVGLLAWQTGSTVHTLNHFGEDTESGAQSEPPYENIVGASAAWSWLSAFVASPDGGEGWQAGEPGGYPALLDGVSCSPGVSRLGARPLLYGSSRSGSSYVSAFVFPPGYAASGFAALVDGVDSCLGEGVDGASGSREWAGGQYALFQSGSVVVGVSGADWRGVRGRAESLLLAGGCVSLSESVSDTVRSPYYDGDGFTGLVESQTVGPSIVDPGESRVSLSAPALDVPSVPEPEGPLPDGFPQLPQRPQVAFSDEAATVDFASAWRTVSYRVADDDGPGCGWSWFGQAAPVVDAAGLAAKRARAVESAQGEADAAAAALYRDRSAARWRGVSGAAVAANAGDYNRRVSEVDAARKALADGRAAFYPEWVSYVSAHDSWRGRVAARDAASSRWESSVTACMGGATSVSPSPSPSPSPSARPAPSPSPSASAGVVKTRAQCERETVKPVEMTVDVGAEPSAPAVPSGVTVPASWPQPRR